MAAGDTVKDLHVAIVGELWNLLWSFMQLIQERKTGAGIGGLALAMALHRQGIPFILYEEAKQYSAVGSVSHWLPVTKLLLNA